MGNHRKNENTLNMAIPMLDYQGNVEGWFQFNDCYLSPEVRYTAFPPTTWVKIGGRFLEIDRAVPLKIRLLEQDEDYHFWCKKKQHSQRINCGEYHKDFGDVEIGYSFSSPQTHIWFAGYAIHADCFENLFLSSHNASVRVTPEHVIPQGGKPSVPRKKDGSAIAMSDLVPSRSLFEMVLEEGADFPIYTAAVPRRVETHKGYKTELVPTAEFINDCEREIIKREAYDIGAAVAQISDPVSYPPTFPPVKPFEHAGLFWSFIYNELLRKRLSRDEMEQVVKDIALLNRFQQYEKEVRQRDKAYNAALDRLCRHFATPEAMHKLTWPANDVKSSDCRCELCLRHGHPIPSHTNIRRLRKVKEQQQGGKQSFSPAEVCSPPSPEELCGSCADDSVSEREHRHKRPHKHAIEVTHAHAQAAAGSEQYTSSSEGTTSQRTDELPRTLHHRHGRPTQDRAAPPSHREHSHHRSCSHSPDNRHKPPSHKHRPPSTSHKHHSPSPHGKHRHGSASPHRHGSASPHRHGSASPHRHRSSSRRSPSHQHSGDPSRHQPTGRPGRRVPKHHQSVGYALHSPDPGREYMPRQPWNAAEVEEAGKILAQVYKGPMKGSEGGYSSGVVELSGSNAPLMFMAGGERTDQSRPVYVEASVMRLPPHLTKNANIPLPQYTAGPIGVGAANMGPNAALVFDQYTQPVR